MDISLPPELTELKQYCVRLGKRPYIYHPIKKRLTARWTGEKDWEAREGYLSFDEAIQGVQREVEVPVEITKDKWEMVAVDGIGFMNAKADDPDKQIVGGDLDACRDPVTGELGKWATAFLEETKPFYTEVSPSGCGVRFFYRATLPGRVDSRFSNGPQDDISEEIKQHILSAKPKIQEKIDLGEEVWNNLELYEANRHLTITGKDSRAFPVEDRTHSLEIALSKLPIRVVKTKTPRPEKFEDYPGMPEWVVDMEKDLAGKRLPTLSILQVINTVGWEESGGQLFGPHPNGSTSQRNVVVNPGENTYCWMHNNINTGGDAWVWLAHESGAVPWEVPGEGLLRDPKNLKMAFDLAIGKGLVTQEDYENYVGTTKIEPPKEEDASKTPSIKSTSIEDPNGTVGILENGTVVQVVKKMQSDGSTIGFLEWISDCAVHIHTETLAKDETEFCFTGVGANDKRPVKFVMPASALAEPKRFKAALINAFGAKNCVGKLTFEMVQSMSLDTKFMKRVEVPTWDRNVPLLPGVEIAENVEYRISPKIPAGVYDGDLQRAKECLQKLLKVHKYAPILIAAILGAPAIARWRKNDRFGLGLWGSTGTLKTTSALTAMGVFGIGYVEGPKLKAGRGGSTLVGAMEVFAAAGFLPQIYDDVKTVDTKDAQNYVATIHAVLEGEEKARGKKDGGLRDSREFNCIPIITGEVRPQEASTSARVLNLNWTDVNGTLLLEVQKEVSALPVVGYYWLRFLAETSFVLGKDFEAFRSQKMEEFLGAQYVNSGRLASIYTLMIGVWNLLEASPMGEVFKDAHDGFKAVLQEAIDIQGAVVGEETEIARFLSALEELLASNPGLIQSEDGKKTIAGAIIGKRMPDGLFLLPTETLNELGKIKTFNQQPTIDSITQALFNKGMLITDGDGQHMKKKVRFNGARPRGWYLRNEVVPIKTWAAPGDGSGKIDPLPSNAPLDPLVPVKKRERKFEENEKNIKDVSERNRENGGAHGANGTNKKIDDIDRLVDSDYISTVHGPTQGPTQKTDGTAQYGEEDVKALIKDFESPSDLDEKIRVAAIAEYGMNGWVNERNIAHKLKIPIIAVTTWLDRPDSGYVPAKRGYKQRGYDQGQGQGKDGMGGNLL
jgi:hypothetical protein